VQGGAEKYPSARALYSGELRHTISARGWKTGTSRL